MIFLACPPVYTLPGTWNDPEKIARCNETLIPHFTFDPNFTFGISIAVITIHASHTNCVLLYPASKISDDKTM